MFLRMMMRAALVRKGRATAALLAVVVAASVATAMLILYVDVQAKLQKEFRKYGANLLIVGQDGAALPANTLTVVDSTLAGQGIAVPFTYAVAKTSQGASVVVAGTDFDTRTAAQSLVVGVRVAECSEHGLGRNTRDGSRFPMQATRSI